MNFFFFSLIRTVWDTVNQHKKWILEMPNRPHSLATRNYRYQKKKKIKERDRNVKYNITEIKLHSHNDLLAPTPDLEIHI